MIASTIFAMAFAIPAALAIPASHSHRSHTTTAATLTRVSTTQTISLDLPTAYTAGEDGIPKPTQAPKEHAVSFPPGPPFVTITIQNHHTKAVITGHVDAGDLEEWEHVVGGVPVPGVLDRYQTAEFAVPTGWEGIVSVVEDGGGRVLNGDVSIIESNYKVPTDGSVNAVYDIDVSYVDGFSVPIVCGCGGPVLTGCNINLWDRSACPAGWDNGVGSCRNPLRDDQVTTSATPFFKLCQGLAYTYINDHAGNSFGDCQNGHVTCCIGTDCPKRP